MRRRLRSLIARSPLAAVGLLVLAVCTSSHGFGQPSVPVGAGALQSLETGISAYQDGALEVALETLSDALLQRELPANKTAEALYYRGLAYRELGKPGQAISDLTKAMSFKNGLSKADLKEAGRNRAGAYREAGLAGTETPIDSGEQSRIPVHVPASRVRVPLSVDAGETRFATTGSIDTPAPAVPSWGDTSVEFAPALAK